MYTFTFVRKQMFNFNIILILSYLKIKLCPYQTYPHSCGYKFVQGTDSEE